MHPTCRHLAVTGLLASAIPGLAAAQVKGEPIVIGTRTSFTSSILHEKRPVWIHVPDNYAQATKARYPVIYVLDGDDHFTEVTGIVHRLSANSRMPDAIIVALPNTKDRTHDLTPPVVHDSTPFPLFEGSADSMRIGSPTRGAAGALRSFITTELAPWVDAHYRTVAYRVLIGHSLGGLFVLDALVYDPQSFRAYVALSPSLWWGDGEYLKRIEDQIPRASLAGRVLYMTTGGRELKTQMIDPAQDLATFLGRSSPAGFQSWFKVEPGEVHDSNPHRSTYDALETIFAGWEPPDSALPALYAHGDSLPLASHYVALSRRFGFDVPLPTDMFNGFADFLLESNHPQQAMHLLRFNAAHDPTSPAAHDALATGFDKTGAKADAVREEREAVRLAAVAHDPDAAKFRKRLRMLTNPASPKRPRT